MKARAPIWSKLVEECLRRGMSYAETAAFLALPVGTVKTWSARKRAKARTAIEVMKPVMKPASAKGKAVVMKPEMKPGKVHRGLTVDMMPGRTSWEKRMNWSLFTRGEWPPKGWRIPAELEGEALVAALAERAFKSKPRGKSQ